MGRHKSTNHRNGGKFAGSHTTVIHAARTVVDAVHKCTAVTKISLGIIKSGLPTTSCGRMVKIRKEGACVLLAIRDSRSIQKVHVFGADLDVVIREIRQKIEKEGIQVVCSE